MNKRIELIVKESGLTKAKFAEKLGVSAPYVTMLCSGAGKASDRTIMDICREFGCNESWLRTGEGEPFRRESEDEKIRTFAERTIQGSDKFRKTFASLLADLEEEDWQALGGIYERILKKRQSVTNNGHA